jgi:UTP--glucose-1-phosphate uridylyltransferase
MSTEGLAAAVEKMRAADVAEPAIRVFTEHYKRLEAGETGIVPESSIDPLIDPLRLADLSVSDDEAAEALDSTVVVKLNGGLGTGMGMAKAKSLLVVRDDLTFIDVIVRQVLHARSRYGARLPLLFMNSFRTQDDTLAVLDTYGDLVVDDLPRDFMQSREPKLRADNLMPVEWADDPELEWCPPGHGDVYTALAVSGVLDRLLDAGLRFAFISNSDNLGALPDATVAGWFASSGAPFASEVVRRTAADRKGGHLAIRKSDSQLILRDSAQTAPEDDAAFQNENRHRFFNANNLWIDLTMLRARLDETDGVLGLPLIRNDKTVDPSDPSSTAVIQIESAMGSAVEVFDGAQAVEVHRARFVPVKTTNDLLPLRSDAYSLNDDYSLSLAGGRTEAPFIDLDTRFYKLVDDFDARFEATPSLVEADALEVAGDWTFEPEVVVRGRVRLTEDGSPGRIERGTELGPTTGTA